MLASRSPRAGARELTCGSQLLFPIFMSFSPSTGMLQLRQAISETKTFWCKTFSIKQYPPPVVNPLVFIYKYILYNGYRSRCEYVKINYEIQTILKIYDESFPRHSEHPTCSVGGGVGGG